MNYKYNDKLAYNELDPLAYHKSIDMKEMHHNDIKVRGWDRDASEIREQYFTLEALESGELGFSTIQASQVVTDEVDSNSTDWFFYSKNDGPWTLATTLSFTVQVDAGDKVKFKRNGSWTCGLVDGMEDGTSADWWYSNLVRVYSTCDYIAYGNIASLWYGDNFVGQTKMRHNGNILRGFMKGMFCEHSKSYSGQIIVSNEPCPDYRSGAELPIEDNDEIEDPYEKHHLIDASNLYIEFSTKESVLNKYTGDVYPAYTYACMFFNCQRLEHGPYIKDPDFIAWRDFEEMFYHCYSLVDAEYCFDAYHGTYGDSYSVSSSSKSSYAYMFAHCYSLKFGPRMIRSWWDKDNMYRSTERYFNLGTFNLNDNIFLQCQNLEYGPAIYTGSSYSSSSRLVLSRTSITTSGNNTLYEYYGVFCNCYLKYLAIFVIYYDSRVGSTYEPYKKYYVIWDTTTNIWQPNSKLFTNENFILGGIENSSFGADTKIQYTRDQIRLD